MAGVKAELFRPINNDDRSGLPDEMPGGFHTHPSEHDLLLGAQNEGLCCHEVWPFLLTQQVRSVRGDAQAPALRLRWSRRRTPFFQYTCFFAP